jgi:photosystem II stability/assembly factor-like uncharacterized protein
VDTWIAVGASGTILRSSDGGIHWTSISSPIADALRGVALKGKLGLAVGISGRVLRTIDGGLNWMEEKRPTSKNLYSVSISNQMAVITGEEGTILVSLDNGLTWKLHTAGTASILFGVSVNGSTAVGVGGQGAIVMSTDGGAGWGLTIIGDQLTFFYSTSFVNGKTGWVVGSSASTGNIIGHSMDYGFVWNRQITPTTEQLFGVSFARLNSGVAVGGNGTIIHTSNGGTNWEVQSSGTSQILNAVSLADSLVGIVVGDGGTILRTTTGGVITGNDDNSPLNSFTLYPNPANDHVTINMNRTNYKDSEITIYNCMGKIITTKQFKENRVDIPIGRLNNGTYFVAVKSDLFAEYRKLVINR